jgi:MFS family permease
MLRKTINFILIISCVSLTGIIISFFFLGSPETYERQLADLPIYFIKRLLGGILLGLILAGLIVLINFLLDKILNDNRIKKGKIFLITAITTSIASLIGTIIFFNH